jgi:integration host factor subunit alpha
VTGKTVTRADLVEALARRANMQRADANRLLTRMLDLMQDALIAGETVKLSRFGNFNVRAKRQRIGRNPKTGEEVPITAGAALNPDRKKGDAMKIWFAAAAALALCGCASTTTTSEDTAAAATFDPSSCYLRDFAVYFDNQDTRLSEAARRVIDAQVDPLRGCRIAHVRIVGLAEDEGAASVSEQISMQRADAISHYIHRRTGWPQQNWELLATGERGAVTESGRTVPMRRRARVVIDAAAP